MTILTTRQCTRIATGALLAAALLLAIGGLCPAQAVQEHRADANHRGVVDFPPYQVFPENRVGNAVYFDQRLVFSLPNETIVDVLPLPKDGRFAYVARDAAGAARVGLYLQPQDRQLRLNEVGRGYTHAVMALDGVVYKKLFRLTPDGLLDLLPSSKTPDGARAGELGVVFYHVAAVSERETLGAEPIKEFGLRLHLSLYEEDRVRDLDYLVTNTLPQLRLDWRDPQHVTFTLADGRTEVISISQFQ